MSEAKATPCAAITVRLDPATRDRVQRIADFEHRSIASYVRMLIDRDLQVRDEAEQKIYVFVAPELVGEPIGTVGREERESDEEYAAHAMALRILLEGH
jgi:hypothetical protein